MWKPGIASDKPNPTPTSPKEQPATTEAAAVRAPFTNGLNPLMAQPPLALIGKTIVIKGKVTGSESLYIDGRVEGSIEVQNQYLHIGENASVEATVTARELVIRGKLHGNVMLGDRLDIRAGGTLVGDVTAKRVSIEDGAYFKGSIDMRREHKDQPEDASALKKDVAAVSVPAQTVAAKAVASSA